MTDVKSWIEERRMAMPDGKNSWVLKPGDGSRGMDALNAVLELHKADMLYENVDRCENYNEHHVDDFHTESDDGVEICLGMPMGVRVCRSCQFDGEPVEYPCPTVQAIEGAISE